MHAKKSYDAKLYCVADETTINFSLLEMLVLPGSAVGLENAVRVRIAHLINVFVCKIDVNMT